MFPAEQQLDCVVKTVAFQCNIYVDSFDELVENYLDPNIKICYPDPLPDDSEAGL